MTPIPLTSTISLKGYVSVLRNIGAPVDSGLRRARLPVLFEECPEAWLSYGHLRSFVGDMAAREGVPDLGVLARAQDPSQSYVAGVGDPLLGSPTLFHALQKVPALASRQTTQVRIWLEPLGHQTRLCVSLPFNRETPGYSIVEPRTLSLFELLLRTFAGPAFVPTRTLLSSRQDDLHFDLEAAYRGVPVVTDQPYSAIEFPRALLWSTRASRGTRPVHRALAPVDGGSPDTSTEILEACIEPYLLEGYPDVALAAEIMGTSIRSLQRTLRMEGTSYREVIDKVRCHKAMDELRNSGLSVTEIALRLGYIDQTAFARAFRRWTCASPSEYRAHAKQAAVAP